MAVIDIKYVDAPGQIIYDSVQVWLSENNQAMFKSNNFVKDWYNALEFFCTKVYPIKKENFLYSTSVNQFLSDGGEEFVDRAYLVFEGDEHKLVYDPEYAGEKLEFFIPKGENWSWNELKNFCKKD